MALHGWAGARSRGHAVARRVVICALARRHRRGRAVEVMGNGVGRGLLVLRRVHDCDVDLCGSRMRMG